MREREAADRLRPAGAVYWMMDEADVQKGLPFFPYDDSLDQLRRDTIRMQRVVGVYSRVSSAFAARQFRLFGLEEAVRRMTGLSASELGLAGRGVIAGADYADVTISTRRPSGDAAAFEAPPIPAAGIEHVFVNGRAGVDRRQAYRRTSRPRAAPSTAAGRGARVSRFYGKTRVKSHSINAQNRSPSFFSSAT